MTAAVLPSVPNSPLLLSLCHPTLCKWESSEGEALARLILLLENGGRTVDEADVPSKGEIIWVKVSNKY